MEYIDFSDVENPDIKAAYEAIYPRFINATTDADRDRYFHILEQINERELIQILQEKGALKRSACRKFGWEDYQEPDCEADFSKVEDPDLRAAYEWLHPKIIQATTTDEIKKYLWMFRKISQWEAKQNGEENPDDAEFREFVMGMVQDVVKEYEGCE